MIRCYMLALSFHCCSVTTAVVVVVVVVIKIVVAVAATTTVVLVWTYTLGNVAAVGRYKFKFVANYTAFLQKTAGKLNRFSKKIILHWNEDSGERIF